MNSLSSKLPRSSPDRLGISAAAIERFIETADAQHLGLHSFMLLRRGQVAACGWWAPYSEAEPHLLYSLSKSFTSTAAGFAVAEGLFALDDLVIDLFAREAPAQPSGNLAKMRVRDLLTMATGHTVDTQPVMDAGEHSTWIDAFFKVPIEKEPGTHFLYNSGASYMVSALVQMRSGQRLLDYLQPRLFNPLGITPLRWEQSPQGIDLGGSGLYLTTEEIAKFGLLYLRGGVLDNGAGERILPESWVQEATSAQVSNGDDPESEWAQGYGFQFWRCRHNAYRGDGAFGQYCIVMPEQNAVLAITAGSMNMPGIMNAVWDRLLPGFRHTEAPHGGDTLQERTDALSIPFPAAMPLPSIYPADRSGVYWIDSDEDTPYGLREVTLRFFQGSHRCDLVMRLDSGEETRITADNVWVGGQSALPPIHGIKQAKTRGAWIAEDVYECVICCVQTPYIVTVRIDFSKPQAEMALTMNVAFGPTSWPVLPILPRA